MKRRNFLLLIPGLPLSTALAAPAGAPSLPEEDVETVYDNGIYRGSFRFAIPVAPRVAWAVLTDFDHMAEFVPNVESSHIASRDGRIIHVVQRGRLEFGPFTFRFESERRIEMRPEEGVILARAVAGTTRHMQSEMHVSADGNGTVLDYQVEMIPDRWIPSSVGVSFMRHELAEQFSAIAREMVRRQQGQRPR